MNCRYPPAPYDWEAELDRFDDHLTDEETVEQQARIAPQRQECAWQSVLGLIGSGVIAVLTVLAFVAL